MQNVTVFKRDHKWKKYKVLLLLYIVVVEVQASAVTVAGHQLLHISLNPHLHLERQVWV